MRGILPVLLATTACGRPPPPQPAAAAPEGLAIAIYASAARSYAVVDDRRWIEVIGEHVLLDRIDPSAPLESLVIEPLGTEPIHIGPCARDRIDDSAEALAQLAGARGERPRRIIVIHGLSGHVLPHDPSTARFHVEDGPTMEPAIVPRAGVLAPVVRCRATARPGRHLVRVLHVTGAIQYRTEHALAMAVADRATIATRFAIATPRWGARARVTLFEGLPGHAAPPRQLVRGPIVLDGSTAILGSEPREVGARLRTIYDGVRTDRGASGVEPTDIAWGRDSHRQVWVWFELTDGGASLPPGPIRAHVALPDQPPRDLAIAADVREGARWPMWIDPELLGSRKRVVTGDGGMIVDRFELSVANLGSEPRELWIEERLRGPTKHRRLHNAWPRSPALDDDVARVKLTLAPGQTERVGFTIDYAF